MSRGAVRHDGERIPYEVRANLIWASQLRAHECYLNSAERRAGLIDRLGRSFAKKKRVAEEAGERLRELVDSSPD